MGGRLRFEAWTPPGSTTFEKICDVPAMKGSTGTVELSDYTDGTVRVPALWDETQIISDTVGSIIRVFDGSTIVDEFYAERVDTPIERPSEKTITGPQVSGAVERMAVYAFQYPDDHPSQQDWIWGGQSILPDLALADLGNTSEVWELYNTGTGTSFTVTVDGQTTIAMSYTTTPFFLEQRLQDLSTVSDVTVAGGGTAADDPWTITFYNPSNPTTVTVADTGGTSTLTKTVDGAYDPSPITITQTADQRTTPGEVGGYATPPIEVVTTSLNTGSDWALLVNATGQYAGSQIILTVKPGATYDNISVPVRPDSAGSYRLVIRDIYENLIAGTNPWEVSLTAGTYQTLTVPGPITIPDGVTAVIFRVAVVQPTYADFRVDWQHATFDEGWAAATPGEIVRLLLENGQTRGTLDWLDPSFTDTVDTDGTTWPTSESFTAWFGSHMGHVLGDLHDLGYEWNITPKASPTSLTHDLNLWIAGGGGSDLTASSGGPTVQTGTVTAANVVKRAPAFTTGLGWGLESLYVESTDAALESAFTRSERVFDAEHLSSTASLQTMLDAEFDQQATNRTATQAKVPGTAQRVPLVDYGPGDTIWWQFPNILDKEARRVRRVSWTHAAIADDLAEYTLHGSKVHTGESAQAAAVNYLLGRYQRRRQTVTGGTPFLGAGQMPYIIAGSNASAEWKAAAHLVCPGSQDHLTIQPFLDELPSGALVWCVGYFAVDVLGTGWAIDVPAGMDIRVAGGGRLAETATFEAYDNPAGSDAVFRLSSSSRAVGLHVVDGGLTSPLVGGYRIADNAQHVTIEGCSYDGDGFLVYGDGCDNVIIRNNRADGNLPTVEAIEIVGVTNDLRIDGNDIIGHGAIKVGDGSSVAGRVWLHNNFSQGAARSGIVYDGTTGGTQAVSIVGNRIIEAGSDTESPGMHLIGGSGTFASAGTEQFSMIAALNHIASTTGDGILIEDCDGVQLSTNHVTLSTLHGIDLDGSSDCQVVGNVLYDNGRNGTSGDHDHIILANNSDNNTVTGNTAKHHATGTKARYGVNVSTSDCNGNIVQDNDLRLSGTTSYNNAGTGTNPAQAASGNWE